MPHAAREGVCGTLHSLLPFYFTSKPRASEREREKESKDGGWRQGSFAYQAKFHDSASLCTGPVHDILLLLLPREQVNSRGQQHIVCAGVVFIATSNDVVRVVWYCRIRKTLLRLLHMVPAWGPHPYGVHSHDTIDSVAALGPFLKLCFFQAWDTKLPSGPTAAEYTFVPSLQPTEGVQAASSGYGQASYTPASPPPKKVGPGADKADKFSAFSPHINPETVRGLRAWQTVTCTRPQTRTHAPCLHIRPSIFNSQPPLSENCSAFLC